MAAIRLTQAERRSASGGTVIWESRGYEEDGGELYPYVTVQVQNIPSGHSRQTYFWIPSAHGLPGYWISLNNARDWGIIKDFSLNPSSSSNGYIKIVSKNDTPGRPFVQLYVSGVRDSDGQEVERTGVLTAIFPFTWDGGDKEKGDRIDIAEGDFKRLYLYSQIVRFAWGEEGTLGELPSLGEGAQGEKIKAESLREMFTTFEEGVTTNLTGGFADAIKKNNVEKGGSQAAHLLTIFSLFASSSGNIGPNHIYSGNVIQAKHFTDIANVFNNIYQPIANPNLLEGFFGWDFWIKK